ncbi:MAG: aromatic ring-hydroxylating dioxygenase subunit alpha [Planctomycetes bacterium]|nr:aromatic ring-hydroxylating dioxygenase subunit alpha [Planctomycetota bacterium]
MFIHETHLPQRLGVQHYTSPEHLDREVETMFLPGWHCVGTLLDLPRDGDYLTVTLFGRPVIVWRSGGDVHAFLNVCTHRFSLLRDEPCGHLDGHLKCQYHGWEYDDEGNTCRIPDARSFRPMEKGRLGLTKYRCETAGQLVFVTFNDDAPPLAEWLGEELFEMCRRWFSTAHRKTVNIDIDHDCNWKVVIENVLEGYHIECVHPNSFRTYPDPERCAHEFHEHWDRYTDDYSKAGLYNRQEKFVSRLAGVEPDYVWHHLLRYPNVVFGKMGLFTWVQMVWPVTPHTSRAMWRIVHYPGQPGRLRSWLVHRMLKGWGRKFMTQVVGEDTAIYPKIHRGLAAPVRPNGGLISIREERIFPFQDYVLKDTGSEPAEPQIDKIP